jgi:hypothetical protein
MDDFNGKAVLCFYKNGLVQGHCISGIKNSHSLAGQHLPDYNDPLHNDCMERDEFFKVSIQNHDCNTTVSLVLRRPLNNDAGNLSSHHHEQEVNQGYSFLFETTRFLHGSAALSMADKYFSKNDDIKDGLIVCIGDINWSITE